MRIITWNLNGLPACVKNGSFIPIEKLKPDAVCCQEIRTKEEPIVMKGYSHHFFPAKEGRYSGTLTMLKEPYHTELGMGDGKFDDEGRIITSDLGEFYLVNVYVPNSQGSLERAEYRRDFDDMFREYMVELNYEKPVIACGDFNTTLLPIDIYEENERMKFAQLGYASDERANLNYLLEQGFVDVFRFLYPDRENAFTWWSNRLNKRVDNRGWRLDYFIISEELTDRLEDVIIHSEIKGSDHCPVELVLKE